VAENAQPVEGTLAFGGGTVTPIGIKGTFRVTRELVDASNPAIDAVAFSTMREDYDRQCELQIFAELNGANGQGGTVTGDTVPSGAVVRSSTGAALPSDLRKTLALYREYRKRRPRSGREHPQDYVRGVGDPGLVHGAGRVRGHVAGERLRGQAEPVDHRRRGRRRRRVRARLE